MAPGVREVGSPWAAAARQKGLGHVKRHAAKLKLADPEAELELDAVTEDDGGVTAVAMRQRHKGVTVHGGSLLVLLDARGAPLELGKTADERAVYLMAVGGTHPYSRVGVAAIGGDRASSAFFKALTLYLYASQFPTLHAVRSATINGCAANHGLLSVTCDSVRQAWKAVGVPDNMIDESWFFTRWHYLDFLGAGPDQGGWAFWADTNINQHCPPHDQPCLDYWRGQVSRAFWDSGTFQSRPDVQASGLLTPGTGRPYDNRQFVRWCYKNYLRRDPAAADATQEDRIGWDFWTDGLNRHGDYNETIRSFLFSDGYRARFIGMH